MVEEDNAGPGSRRTGPDRDADGRHSASPPDGAAADLTAWRVVGASIAILLLAMVLAGVVAIVENNRVINLAQEALTFDIEVEDETSDVQIAVLTLRHVHRDIAAASSPAAMLPAFDDAVGALMEELDELAALDLAALGAPQPDAIRALAETYDAEFRSAIARAADDPLAFQAASAVGLARIDEMDAAAAAIDDLGDWLADNSLQRLETAVRTEQVILIGLISGALVVGATLAISAGRLLRRLRGLYGLEQEARRALARSLQTKSDFIADASHELRTPLAVILGNAETALASRDPKLHETSLAAIAAETQRMRKLVDDLLFLARSDAGSPPLEREYVPARWLASRLVKPADMLARQRASCLSERIAGEGYLEVDPERIEQAVLILVDNAARHSPTGACVSLTSRVEGSWLAIDVADAGPGIPPDELPYVFDRFYQVKNRRSRKKGGAGLGLSIARTIVAAHGGGISAESTPGDGTRMTIRLPLAAPPERLDPPPPAPARQANAR